MNYPTKEEVERANHHQICIWYRFLPSPGDKWLSNYSNEYIQSHQKEIEEKLNQEVFVINLIFEKWKAGGGFTPELSKSIGWNNIYN